MGGCLRTAGAQARCGQGLQSILMTQTNVIGTGFSLPLTCCASCRHHLPISALLRTTFMSLGTDWHDSPNQLPPV